MTAPTAKLLFFVWMILAGGCALPRAFAIHDEVAKSVPVIHGAKRSPILVNPALWDTSGSCDMDSATDQAMTIEWYRYQLAATGWEEFADRAKSDPSRGITQFYFQRPNKLPRELTPGGGMFDMLTFDLSDRNGDVGTHVHAVLHVPKYWYSDWVTLNMYYAWVWGGHRNIPPWLLPIF